MKYLKYAFNMTDGSEQFVAPFIPIRDKTPPVMNESENFFFCKFKGVLPNQYNDYFW